MQGTLLILVFLGAPLSLVAAVFLKADLPSERFPTQTHQPKLAAEIARIIPHEIPSSPRRFISSRIATMLLLSPVLMLSGLLGLVSGLRAREKVLRNFEFSSPTVFMMSRGLVALSIALIWSYGYIPIKIPSEFLLVPAAALYAGLRLSTKHMPLVW